MKTSFRQVYYNSLHQPIGPVAMILDDRKQNISMRVEPSMLTNTLPMLEALWNKYETRYPLDYYFLDDYFAQSYQKEQQMVQVIALFAGIAIFIACLGLYGLLSFAITRRRKEIGVRKVLGATVPSIVLLLLRNFLSPVIAGLLLATPVVWYFLNEWLRGFAYHIKLGPWVFFVAGMVMMGIVLVTVRFQSVRAAVANPVESLRNE